MKRLALILLVITVSQPVAKADDSLLLDEGKIERDYFDDDKYNILDDENEKQGYIRKDPFSDDKINIYNKDHEKVGTLERNYFNKDRWDVKEKD